MPRGRLRTPSGSPVFQHSFCFARGGPWNASRAAQTTADRRDDPTSPAKCARRPGRLKRAFRLESLNEPASVRVGAAGKELCRGKILSAAGWGRFVFAGQPVHQSGNEKRESGTSEERQLHEHVGDAPSDKRIGKSRAKAERAGCALLSFSVSFPGREEGGWFESVVSGK
jgi:hypothetical protein